MKKILDLCNKYNVWVEVRPNCVPDILCVKLKKFFKDKDEPYSELLALDVMNYNDFKNVLITFVDNANKEFMKKK